MSNNDFVARVLAVVRGDEGMDEFVAATGDLGIASDLSFEPAGTPIVEPAARDFAQGAYVRWARATENAEWAQAMLGANFIDFRCLEDEPTGEQVLEILWKMAGGETLVEDDVDLLRRVAES